MGRTVIIHRLLWFAFGMIALGIAIALPVQYIGAQGDDEVPEYVGSSECQDCHRGLARDHADTPHALALQDVERNKDGILADFEQGADLRMVQFPGEDAPRPFTADDIVFAVGAGRYLQRYVYETPDEETVVLPAEWNTVTQTWQPYTLGATWPSPEYDWIQNCAGCHTTGLDLERGRWEDEGVQCEACHGPGSIHAEIADDAGSRPDDDELIEIHGAIVVSPDAQICGQCHSQGMAPDSAHPYPTAYRPGTQLLDPTIFQLVSEDDANAWYETGHGRLNNMQFNEWMSSAHASSLDTLTRSSSAQDGCVACHSGDYSFTERIRAVYEEGDLSGEPPASTTLATAQFSITCTTCHSPHTAAETEFNLVTTAYELCTSCHRNTDLVQPVHHPVAEMFEGQPIIDGVDGVPSVHFSAEDGPRCVTCHMSGVPIDGASLANHTWRPVIPGESVDSPPDACSECHTGLLPTDLQSLIEDTQASVRSRLSVARARLSSIAVPEEGSAASADYNRVVTALNFVQNDGSLGVHNYAYVDALLDHTSILLAQLSVPGASIEPTEGPAPTATPSQPEPIAVGMELPARTGFRPVTIIVISVVALILLGGSAFILRQARRKTGNQEAAS
ncbi:MAG: cytochrome c3 family protein [Anaerolineae bacterium]